MDGSEKICKKRLNFLLLINKYVFYVFKSVKYLLFILIYICNNVSFISRVL